MYPLWVQSPVALIFKVKAKFHLRNFHIRDKNVWKSTWIIQLITHLKTDKWNFWISYLLLLVNANAIFQKYSKIFKSTLLGYFDNAIFALRYWNMRCIFNKSLRHCTIVDGLADVWTKMFLSMKKKFFSAVFFQAQKCDMSDHFVYATVMQIHFGMSNTPLASDCKLFALFLQSHKLSQSFS